MLEPQDRVLDIGCAWGAFLCWAALRHQIYGVGLTPSRCQFDRARGMVSRNGLNSKIDIRSENFRNIDDAGCYDKILSVEMCGRAGHSSLQAYFEQIAKLLRPGGLLLDQMLYLPNAEARTKIPNADFIEKHVFSGGAIPTLPAIMQQIGRAGLESRTSKICVLITLVPSLCGSKGLRRASARRSPTWDRGATEFGGWSSAAWPMPLIPGGCRQGRSLPTSHRVMASRGDPGRVSTNIRTSPLF